MSDDRAVSGGLEATPAAARRPKLTNKTLFVLGSMNMIDCINVNLLTPYVDKMVSDFLDTDSADPKVAHVVGLLIGLYSLCEVCFSPIWGALSDRVGRRPALLIGLGGSVIAPILFGLGTNLTTVFVARALDGFFCGNMGVSRTYLGEIVDETNEAKGFSFLAVCFSLGLFIGPMLGGELVYPAQWAPSIFANTIFDEYPFLLPNLTYAVFAAVAWIIGAIFLEETLPSARCPCFPSEQHARSLNRQPVMSRQTSGTDPLGAPRSFTPTARESNQGPVGFREPPAATSSRGYPPQLIQTIIGYCALAGWSSAAQQLFILIVSFPRSIDGFELGPQQIGALQNVSAVALMITNLFFYTWATRRFGFLWCFKLGWTLCMICHLLFPAYGLLADPDKFGFWRYVPLGFMQFFMAIGGGLMFPTAFAFINRASEGLNRGAVNGWANSSGALCRAAFPPAAAYLLSLGRQINPEWGRYIAVYVNCLVGTLFMLIALPGMSKVDGNANRPVQQQDNNAGGEGAAPHEASGSRKEPFLREGESEREAS